jgi:hypothetical protein
VCARVPPYLARYIGGSVKLSWLGGQGAVGRSLQPHIEPGRYLDLPRRRDVQASALLSDARSPGR